MTLSLLRRGQLIKVPPPEKALAFLAERGEQPGGAPAGRRAIIGAPEKVRDGIAELAATTAPARWSS
jgi:alkanesulfonate monooxygenase SsuD/methylene tetrahydromethanopterin reductase-like flavin-dependent oxidoreductase (luciferase family)